MMCDLATVLQGLDVGAQQRGVAVEEREVRMQHRHALEQFGDHGCDVVEQFLHACSGGRLPLM